MHSIDDSARVVDSSVGQAEIREHVTIHDSELGDGCRVYERSSIKKSRISDEVDVNAGTYVENAEVGSNVQIGPNCSIVGVTHDLSEQGMEFRNDVFERIILREGVFVGAGAVLAPGIEIGERTVISAGTTVSQDVGPEKIVLGSPPTQKIVDLHEWTNR
ncbi:MULTISPECIES: acyltransferase [Natrialbaceae]|uniref:acyltransferase n=1 Tax=Natrialbaceae TaxID=1644061 RepID=UPI00207C19A2|nr:DapH/DapD/GlmU-related protein [Natronococcus sp. CG52]